MEVLELVQQVVRVGAIPRILILEELRQCNIMMNALLFLFQADCVLGRATIYLVLRGTATCSARGACTTLILLLHLQFYFLEYPIN